MHSSRTFVSRFSRSFSKEARERGHTYYIEGQVNSFEMLDDGVEAIVVGSEAYAVSIDRAGDDLGRCTCEAFQRFGPCKHMWAVLLEIDLRGLEPPPRRRKGSASAAKKPALAAWQKRLERMARVERIGREDPWAGLDQADVRIVYSIIHHGVETLDDQVVVCTARSVRLRNGGWSPPRDLRLADAVEAELDEEDRSLFALLRQRERVTYYHSNDAQHHLDPALAGEALPRMAATGRLEFGEQGALAWDADGTWSFVLELDDEADGRVVRGGLERAGETIGIDEIERIIEPCLFVARGRLGRLDAQGAQQWLNELRRSGPVRVPEEDAEGFAQLVAQLPRGAWRAGAPGVVVGVPRGRLHIAPALEGRAACEVSFEYDGARARPGLGARTVEVASGSVVRDEEAERRLLAQYLACGATRSAEERRVGAAGTVAARDVPVIVRSLLEAGWIVEADGHRVRRAGVTRVSVTTGIDWFELEAGLAFDDQEASLPELLRAVRDGTYRVQLGDGSVGMLPEDWLKSWGLVSLADGEGERGLRFRTNQGWLLDALLAEKEGVARDAGFERYRETMAGFSGVHAQHEPEGFQGELRPYQRDGLGWFEFLRELGLGGCLADDMGLGKTVQVLALLEGRRLAARAEGSEARPSIVVAPRSLIFNWIDEAARFTPHLRTFDYTGPDRRERWDDAGQVDLIVTTYGLLRRDAQELAGMQFDYAVLDEATAIKNAGSQSAKAARLLDAEHRLALSGTPIENHLGELWSLFEFLNPGMLGRTKTFQKLCASGDDGPRLDELARALRPFFLRRTKGEVLQDLPPKSEQIILCDLEPEERKRYDELRAHYRGALLGTGVTEQGLQRNKIHVFEALLRLRQAACHPGLIDPARSGESSAKVETLLGRLEELASEGHKVLVFSQFTSLLSIVRTRLDDAGIVYEYLDGRTRDRKARVERFQNDPDCPLFLISLKAGGHGLNLTASDYVFLLDPWWNPAVEAQAVDRAHRIGQTKPVFAYRLIARNTVEQRVLELQERKRELANALLGEGTSVLKDMTREDLESLLS